ncbi:MAG: hypothetical protein E6713_17825, partial [Sporomusaceae bacterium]|nr:hypothetical protein [Sporomusaceae bacterium]
SKIFILALAGFMLIGVSSFWENPVKTDVTTKDMKLPSAVEKTQEEVLEAKLANLLSQVKGAGSVTVQVTLAAGASTEFAKNATTESRTIQEKDPSGGVRTTTENKKNEQVLLAKENGIDKPVIVNETKPVVKGVLVIAEGAGDSSVKANLTKAVETGLGIAAYRVTVLPQRR